MPYVTVFDITQKPFEWWWSAFGLMFVAIGLVLIRFGPQIDRFASGAPARIVGWFFVIFASGWTLLAFGGTYIKYLEYRRAYQNGQYSIVRGLVEDFRPMPYEGHKDECFRVSQKQFCYSDYEVSPAFNQSASHGGPIRANIPVRIAYLEDGGPVGHILRLEVRADSLTPGAVRAAQAKAEEQKMHQRFEEDPFADRLGLGFSFAAVLISLCWNLDWRHYMRYWIKSGPPYSPFWERAFRAFFLACLAGSSVSLVRMITGKHRTLPELEKAALCSLIAIAFFGVFDLILRLRLRARGSAKTT